MNPTADRPLILIDGREFVAGRRTGIGRFLEGLLLAITAKHPEWRVSVAMTKQHALPSALTGKVSILYLPYMPELWWPRLAEGCELFLSPYPKLPWRRLPCPAIHTVHDVLYLTHPSYRSNSLKRLLSQAWLSRSLAGAALSWFVSESSRRECEVLVGGEVSGVVRHSPVDDCFTPAEAEREVLKPFMLYVGNGMPHKNLDVLFRALRSSPFRLCCVGVRSEVAAQLQSRYPGVAGRVDFQAEADDRKLLELYRDATALLLPSTAEGFGFPPLEAMACGTPAIVSDIPVLRETTGGHALFCDPQDAEAWERAMHSILEQKVRQDLLAAAQPWIEARRGVSGWSRHIADIEAVLESGRITADRT